MDELLGVYLKNARDSKKMTVEDIVRETKIQKRYIEAIESENFDEIPGETYIKGFLRNYATTVGLNPNEVIEKYEKRKKSIDENTLRDENVREDRKIDKKIVKYIIILLVILAVIYVIINGISFFKGKTGENDTSSMSVNEGVYTTENKSSIEESKKKENSITKSSITTLKEDNEKSEVIKKDEKKNEKQNVVNTINSIEKKAETKIDKSTGDTTKNDTVIKAEELKTVVKPSRKEVLDVSDIKVEKIEFKNIKIKATGLSWLEITEGKRRIFKNFVKSGENKEIKTKERVFIIVEDSSKVKIEFNGKDIGELGKANEIFKKEF